MHTSFERRFSRHNCWCNSVESALLQSLKSLSTKCRNDGLGVRNRFSPNELQLSPPYRILTSATKWQWTLSLVDKGRFLVMRCDRMFTWFRSQQFFKSDAWHTLIVSHELLDAGSSMSCSRLLWQNKCILIVS